METKRKIKFKKIKEIDTSVWTKASVPIAKGVYLSEWLIIDSKEKIEVITPYISERDMISGKTSCKSLLEFSEQELKERWLNRIKEVYRTWKNTGSSSEIVKSQVTLFKEYFKGREVLFAKYWKSRDGRKGYRPACRNEWKKGICSRTCRNCTSMEYLPVTDGIYHAHLTGNDAIGKLFVVGIYPLQEDGTSYFIAADFDGAGSLNQARDFMKACSSNGIPAYLERSMSGAGCHVWIFFKKKIPAWKSRKVVLEIVRRAALGGETAAGFDRLFPNQDRLTGKGLGNLIALPLQGRAVKKGCTIFLDPANRCKPYPDQWNFLRSIIKIDEKKLDELIDSWNLNRHAGSTPRPRAPGNRKGLERIMENCDFIRYCIDNAESLTEPLWYCMISNVAVFEGGAEKIHEFSKPYHGYTRTETEAKIEHALSDTGPHRCDTIRKEGFLCRKNCGVKSPAGLGYRVNNFKNGG